MYNVAQSIEDNKTEARKCYLGICQSCMAWSVMPFHTFLLYGAFITKSNNTNNYV